MSSKTENRLLNVDDVADILGLHRVTVYEKVARGEIPHIRIGRTIRFDREKFNEWLVERTTTAAVA